MEKQELGRREVLRKVGLIGAAGAVALVKGAGVASAGGEQRNALRDEEHESDPLVGMWDVTVIGQATYYYTYSIARDAFVATGNIDSNWDGLGSSFGPTMGSYLRDRRRSYGIREKGWAFDPQGNPAGSFGFIGTYVVDNSGVALSGGGTWTLYDLAGNAVFVETLTVTGTKVSA